MSSLRFHAAVAELTALGLAADDLVGRFLALVQTLEGVRQVGVGALTRGDLELRAVSEGAAPEFAPRRRVRLPAEAAAVLDEGCVASWEDREEDGEDGEEDGDGGRGASPSWCAVPLPSRWLRGGALICRHDGAPEAETADLLGRAAALVAARLDTLGLVGELREASRRVEEDTDRNAREAARWAHIFRHVGWGVATLSLDDGRIEHVNPAFARMHGAAPQALIGSLAMDLVAPRERGRMDALGDALARQGVVTVRTTHIRADGTEFPVVSNISLVRGESRSGTYIALHLRDVTERQRLEEELRHAQRLESVGRLAGGVAHDFNNILSTVIGYSELALLEVTPGSVLESYISSIHLGGERAAALTAQLLAFSRRQVLNPSAVRLSELVREVVDMVRRLIGEDVQLVLDLSPEPLEVEADSAQLQQVVMNLLVNARDAMPKGGRLGVVTARQIWSATDAELRELAPGAYASLSVLDDGIGMSSEVREHIFEPFFTTKPASEGTGLGLSTSYGIVRQHRGVIEVDSSPGSGSEFRVLIPLNEGAQEASPREPAEPSVSLSGSERVLVVDDLADIRELVAALLGPLGYVVEQAPSAEAAMARIARAEPPVDVVLTDVVLTGRSGLDLARAVGGGGEAGEPVVVLMSGYSDARAARADASEAGLAYLEKPLDGRRLATAIREALRRASRERGG